MVGRWLDVVVVVVGRLRGLDGERKRNKVWLESSREGEVEKTGFLGTIAATNDSGLRRALLNGRKMVVVVVGGESKRNKVEVERSRPSGEKKSASPWDDKRAATNEDSDYGGEVNFEMRR
jgi:hypothetical protein